MATVTINHKPDLTKDRAREIFAESFRGKYEVSKARVIGRDFIVKKSGWTGVGVLLRQSNNETTFVFSALMPNVLLRGTIGLSLLGLVVSYIFLRSGWKAMEGEIADFIQSAPEFQPAA